MFVWFVRLVCLFVLRGVGWGIFGLVVIRFETYASRLLRLIRESSDAGRPKRGFIPKDILNNK